MALVRAMQAKMGTWDEQVPELLDAQCGYCGKAVAMPRLASAFEWARERSATGYDHEVWATYICPREQCLKPTLMFFTVATSSRGGYSHLADEPRQIPRGQAKPMEGLPGAVQGDRLEAWSCYYGGDLRAAVIMGRASIQRAVRQLNAKGAGLKTEIADLAQRRTITNSLKEWADEARIAGDDAAHPETLGEIDSDEARQSLEFMDAFLEHAIALRAKRDARKEARKPPSE